MIIANHPDFLISRSGRVFSLKTNKFRKDDNSRYPKVILDGKPERIHRLVAETFLPKIAGKNQVHHIDGNTKNYHYRNLMWVSVAEHKKLQYKKFIEKFTPEDINYMKGLSQKKLEIYLNGFYSY